MMLCISVVNEALVLQSLPYFGGFFMTLTWGDITEAVAKEADFPKNQSVELVESLIELINKTLVSRDHGIVSIFRKFYDREKTQEVGRNPAPDSNDEMMLRPRRVVTFHCSGKCRDEIDKSQ
jgi:integration host factor subunit alpha